MSIAPTLLPYLLERPLNLHRFPDGVEHKGFWQKQAPKYAPDWIPRWRNEAADAGESELYLVVDSPPALAWLANHAAVELHPWTSRIPDVERPTYALIDLDPGESTTWDELITLARLHRTALEHLGVRGYPKTSGRRGLQVWVPIEPGPTFDETRAWVERLSRSVAAVVGDLVSGAWEKQARGGRARLDYTQNAINKTLVAPYSVRASAGAPVSMPITWDELDDPDLRSDRWTIRDALDRAGRGRRSHGADAQRRATAPAARVRRRAEVSLIAAILLAMSDTNGREERAGVPLTNLDQTLFDDAGATKRDLVEYLDAVSDRIIPALENRALSVIRVHRGQEAFMQKNVPKYTPSWVRTVDVWAEASHRNVSYALCNDLRTLIWFANQRAIEYHPSLIRDRAPRPDDASRSRPRPARGRRVPGRRPRRAAGTPGARRRRDSKARSRPVARRACTSSSRSTRECRWRTRRPRPAPSPPATEKLDPDIATTAFMKEDRGGKVFVDATRVGGATVIAAYSPRVRPGVPVSFPLPWDSSR